MSGGLLVFHFNRAVGCDSRLLKFLAWWQMAGPFPITIPEYGGLRADAVAQEKLFAAHVSRAKTLEETPHGRGGAIDAYPAILDPRGEYVTGIELDYAKPETKVKFHRYGDLAEAHGLSWGGRWAGFPDYPHVEVPDWRSLPYPPKTGV